MPKLAADVAANPAVNDATVGFVTTYVADDGMPTFDVEVDDADVQRYELAYKSTAQNTEFDGMKQSEWIGDPPEVKVILQLILWSHLLRLRLRLTWTRIQSSACLPRRTHNFPSHSDICFCRNFSGDAADTFLNSCFAERTISAATAAF